MAATRKFYVKRNTTPIRKNQNGGNGGVVTPIGQKKPKTPVVEPQYPSFKENPNKPIGVGAYGGAQSKDFIQDKSKEIGNINTQQKWISQVNQQKKQNNQTGGNVSQPVVTDKREPSTKEDKAAQEMVIDEAARNARMNKREREKNIGESVEERQNADEERDVDKIEQESVNARDIKEQKEQAKAAEEQAKADAELQKQRALEQAGISAQKQEVWKKLEREEKLMAGLGLGTDIAAKTVGALGSIINMGKMVLQNPLSTPTVGAQIMMNAVTDMGAAMQGVVDGIGQSLGIKDGVRQQDIIGTFKGAKYYEDHRNAEIVQQQFNKEMEYITKDVFGEDADPGKFSELLQNAIDTDDVESLRKITDRIVDIVDRPENQALLDDVYKERNDRNNDGVPKDRKHKASAQAKMFYALYSNYLHGVVNAAEHIGAINGRRAAQIRSKIQFENEIKRNNERIAREQERDDQRRADEQAQEQFNTDRQNWYGGLSPQDREFVDAIEGVMGENSFPQMDNVRATDNSLAINDKRKAQEIIGKLDWKSKNGGLSPAEQKVYDILYNRLNPPKIPKVKKTPEEQIKELYGKDNKFDGMGGSFDWETNNKIMKFAQDQMRILERDKKKGTEEYRKWYSAYQAARLSRQYNHLDEYLKKSRVISQMNMYLAANPLPVTGTNKTINNTADLIKYMTEQRKKSSKKWGAYGSPVGKKRIDPDKDGDARELLYSIPSVIRVGMAWKPKKKKT